MKNMILALCLVSLSVAAFANETKKVHIKGKEACALMGALAQGGAKEKLQNPLYLPDGNGNPNFDNQKSTFSTIVIHNLVANETRLPDAISSFADQYGTTSCTAQSPKSFTECQALNTQLQNISALGDFDQSENRRGNWGVELPEVSCHGEITGELEDKSCSCEIVGTLPQ